jgi:hypothetical protein
MSSARKAVIAHWTRRKDRGIVRLEVQAPASDAGLIRALGAALRGDEQRARELRAVLRSALRPEGNGTLLDLLACDISDELVDEALARPRDVGRAPDL